MNLRHNAAWFVLSFETQKELERQLSLLDEAEDSIPDEVQVLQSYEYCTLDQVVTAIDQFEDAFKEVWNAALDVAVNNLEAEFQPMGWLAEKHQEQPFIAGVDYEVPVLKSHITKHKL